MTGECIGAGLARSVETGEDHFTRPFVLQPTARNKDTFFQVTAERPMQFLAVFLASQR